MCLKPYLLYFTDPVVDRLPLTPLAREGSMTKVCPNLDPVRIRAPYVRDGNNGEHGLPVNGVT